MNRLAIAMAGNFGSAERWYLHTQTPGKPTAPSTAGLTADELVVFNNWLNKRMNGTVAAADEAALVGWPNVKTMIASYETYFASADYVAWAHQDLLLRDAQWAWDKAGSLMAVAAKKTQSVSSDPTGAGANAPSGLSPADAGAIVNKGAGNYDISSSGTPFHDDIYTVPSTVTGLYIYDFAFSIFVPSTWGFQYSVEIVTGGGLGTLWKEYLEQATSTKMSVGIYRSPREPIFVPAGSPVSAYFILSSGTATGAKGAFAFSGFLQ